MPEDKSSKSLLTTLALLILTPVISTIVSGQSLSNSRVFVPGIVAAVLLIVAYVPKLQAMIQQQTAGGLERLASDTRIWLALFSVLWLYFAGTSLIDRWAIVSARTGTNSSLESTLVSGWPLPTKAEISDLADDLREYQPKIIEIIFDDSKEEALALDFAKAMQLANWTEVSVTAQRDEPRLGIEIDVGSEITGVLDPLKKFCRKQLKTEPTIGKQSPMTPSGPGTKSVVLVIGHNDNAQN